MSFISLAYLTFLFLLLAIYRWVPQGSRWALLLAASYYFYACWSPVYSLLMLGTTTMCYVCGLAIHRCTAPMGRKLWLVVGCVTSLSVLFLFKYFDFAFGSLAGVFSWFGRDIGESPLNFLLPIGISFYTFQAIGYVIDVYRKQIEPERHFGHFALFVSFFPQLVAGPIERAGHLLGQLKKLPSRLVTDDLKMGFGLIMMGALLKAVVADNIGPMVDNLFGSDPERYTVGMLAMGCYTFGFQIYADFFAYSIIAQGSARLFGVRLMDNFRQPFLATSLQDFWRRWHISLSTWFRDYVYIPLGGSRAGEARIALNLVVVFLVSGLWHGASWTFVLWGLGHGLCFVAEREMQRRGWLNWLDRLRWSGFIKWALTFHIVSALWFVFRVDSIGLLGTMLQSAWVRFWEEGAIIGKTLTLVREFPATFAAILVLLAFDWVCSRKWQQGFRSWPLGMRWVTYYAALVVFMLFGNFGGEKFIYFQF